MEITYLTQLSTFNERPFPNEGLSMEQIRDLRDKFNNNQPFPKAFEEYLYLAGAYNNIGFDDLGTLEELQEEMTHALEECNQKMERPWFVFHEIDWSFSIILLDETDDNPKVYYSHPPLAQDDSYYVLYDSGYRFDEYINISIQDVWDFD